MRGGLLNEEGERSAERAFERRVLAKVAFDPNLWRRTLG
jgi:hypothetical protein